MQGGRAKRVTSVRCQARHFKDCLQVAFKFQLKICPRLRVHTAHASASETSPSFLFDSRLLLQPSLSYPPPALLPPKDPCSYLISKMKCAAILALAGSAAAFAPTQQAGRMSTSMGATAAQRDFFGLKETMDFSKELGVQAPVSTSSLLCWK